MVAFFFPPFMGGGELTLVGQNVDDDATVGLPVGSAAGDLCIYGQVIAGAVGITLGTPSGYTVMRTVGPTTLSGSFNVAARVGAKVLAADTQVATGTTLGGPNGVICTFCRVYRHSNGPVTGFTYLWNTGEATSGNPSPQTVDPSAEIPPLIIEALALGQSGFSFSGSPALQGTLGDSLATFGEGLSGYSIINGTPVSYSIDMPDTGAYSVLLSGWVRPAA